MKANLRIDQAGRIVLPKPVRDKLQLLPGDELNMDVDEDRILLRPARGAVQLQKKRGVWVYYADEPLSAATVRETVERVRRERDDLNLGKSR